MPLLHEIDRDDFFVLTPDYDAMMTEWAVDNPECPDPRFTDDEAAQLVFVWPNGVSRSKKRAANGRFAKNG